MERVDWQWQIGYSLKVLSSHNICGEGADIYQFLITNSKRESLHCTMERLHPG